MRRPVCLLLSLCGALIGCADTAGNLYDFDGDGVQDSEDCDPADPTIHSGADDPFGDDIDQDCDGGDGIDIDGDGYPANEELAGQEG